MEKIEREKNRDKEKDRVRKNEKSEVGGNTKVYRKKAKNNDKKKCDSKEFRLEKRFGSEFVEHLCRRAAIQLKFRNPRQDQPQTKIRMCALYFSLVIFGVLGAAFFFFFLLFFLLLFRARICCGTRDESF